MPEMTTIPADTDTVEGQARDMADDVTASVSLFVQAGRSIGGMHLIGRSSPVRDSLIEALTDSFDQQSRAVIKIPINIELDRLTGGMDLAATLATGSPVYEPGLLEKADGGLVILSMAERQSAGVTRLLATALDEGGFQVERDGQSRWVSTRFSVLALDEADEGEEGLAANLIDRLALTLNSDYLQPADLLTARDAASLAEGAVEESAVLTSRQHEEIASVGAAFAIPSLRAPILASRVAETLAALQGEETVSPEIMATAIRLVLVPKALVMPAPPDEETPPEEQQDAAPPPPANDQDDQPNDPPPMMDDETPPPDQLIDAVLSSLPEDLWRGLFRRTKKRAKEGGRKAAAAKARMKGRPKGYRRGSFRSGDRLHLLATLRAAAPWQRVRAKADGQIMALRPDDFRIKKYKAAERSGTVFVVDASGSSAFNRLAEAKGAVELMLADCYIRRDEVAVVAFRGEGAEVLLSPTRSLARAKASLSRLPGGGATPIAAGLEKAAGVAAALEAKGLKPYIVVLTEGGANKTRGGETGRRPGLEDALSAAKDLAEAGYCGVVIDTGPRARRDVVEIADAAQFDHVALPVADSARIAGTVTQARSLAMPTGDG